MVARTGSKAKNIILSLLQQRTDHPSADKVFFEVRNRIPRVSLGTVYRNLDQLCTEGQIRKLSTKGDSKRYDGNVAPHHHVFCKSCGKVEDLFEIKAKDLVGMAEQESRFQIKGFSIEFHGLCHSCSTSTNRASE